MKKIFKVLGIVVLYIIGVCMQVLFGVLEKLDTASELLTYMVFAFSSVPVLTASFLASRLIKNPSLKAIKIFFVFHAYLGLAFFTGACLYILIRFAF